MKACAEPRRSTHVTLATGNRLADQRDAIDRGHDLETSCAWCEGQAHVHPLLVRHQQTAAAGDRGGCGAALPATRSTTGREYAPAAVEAHQQDGSTPRRQERLVVCGDRQTHSQTQSRAQVGTTSRLGEILYNIVEARSWRMQEVGMYVGR